MRGVDGCPACRGDGVVPAERHEVWRRIDTRDGQMDTVYVGEDHNGNKPCPSCFPNASAQVGEAMKRRWERFLKDGVE